MRHRPIRALLASALVLTAGACGGEDRDPVKDALARERAAAHFRTNNTLARAELAPLLERKDAAAADLVTAAVIELVDGNVDKCKGLLDRAEKADPKSAAAAYVRGQLALQDGDFEAALKHFRKAHELAPSDLPTKLSLALALHETGDSPSAEKLYREVIDVGLENGQLWYATAVFRMARFLTMSDREAEAEPFNRIWAGFEKRGATAPDFIAMAQGELAKVRAPKPTASKVSKPVSITLDPVRDLGAELRELWGAHSMYSWDVDGDQRPDLVAVGGRGVHVALRRGSTWEISKVVEGPTEIARAFDVDNDADLDVLVLQPGGLALHVYDDGTWKPSPATFPVLPSAPTDVVPVDYDHEGDIDLLLVGEFGARIWRNDGAGTPDESHGFVDASEVAGFPEKRVFWWALAEDFDGDNDVDFLLGTRDSIYLADSLRAGRFDDKTRVFPAGSRFDRRPIVADFDRDGRPDLWTPQAIWFQQSDGQFQRRPSAKEFPKESWKAQALDVDLDGTLDLVWSRSRSAATLLLAAGTPEELELEVGVAPADVGSNESLLAADFDGDQDIDLVLHGDEGIQIADGRPSGNRAALLSYRGLRNNRRALGSIVEYRAGDIYRRIYWRGEPVLAGVGKAEKIDVLRITWPNGIVQTSLDVDLRSPSGVDDPDAAFKGITEDAGQFGSCPFLYANAGGRVVFVSDVLGGTPLGLPAKPGLLVPFRHEEHVLVRGDQLAPVDGMLELHLTEELREVTYLDQARLSAVDHPAGTSIHPNERFCFPPFPEPYLHAVASTIPPARATGSDGKEWTPVLAEVDDVHAEPFTLEAPQFAGRAKPWFLELAFDREAVERAEKLRLVMTGWLYWSDSTANMASAGQGLEFLPPTLQIPDGRGGWKDAGPPVGFPSGKTKAMVVDVTSILPPDDPRIRVATNLRLYWDAILLAVDSDDAPREVVTLEPSSAKIWRRGFSAPLEGGGRGRAEDSRPERFEWSRLAEHPRWNQMPGMYTRYGECLELVTTVDDRYAMIGAGDALTLRFDARALPPPRDGFVRDWILFLDGWCKDADLNTVAAETVEPLPFHGMSAYPYPADERFPDDEEHRRWRAEWNTRPAHRWIAPLAGE